MKLARYAVFTTFITALVFFIFYTIFDVVAVASTGYNATSRGLFGWLYAFAEHDFIMVGDHDKMTLIDSGTEVIFTKLLAEIAVCFGFGLVASLIVTIFMKVYRSSFD